MPADSSHSAFIDCAVTVVVMHTSQASPEQTWGAPAPEPETPHWSIKKTLAAVGIAAVLAAGGAVVIHAASGGGGTEGRGGPGFGGGQGFGGGGPGGGPGFGGGGPGGARLPASLHGEFVVSDGHGGFTTELTQTGTVTDISDTSITARSQDGYTQTYVITTDTRQGRTPVHAGDTAAIRAVAGNGTNTATVISPQR
jgi:hypothetical protein